MARPQPAVGAVRYAVATLLVSAFVLLLVTLALGFEEPNGVLWFAAAGFLLAAAVVVFVHLQLTALLTPEEKRTWHRLLLGRYAPRAWREYLTAPDLGRAAARLSRKQLVLIACALTLGATPAAAQDPPTTISASAGVSIRGIGDVNACCGPYQPDVERFRAPWFGGSVSTRVAPGFSLGGEFTWMREPTYNAYVQGPIADAEVRLYAAENRITTWTLAGLARMHAWRTEGTLLDVVAGAGLAREHRTSALRSGVLRPGPPPWEPGLTAETNDGRSLLLGVVGLDLSVSQARMVYGVTTRLMLTGPRDRTRTDLEAGRARFRLGASVGARF